MTDTTTRIYDPPTDRDDDRICKRCDQATHRVSFTSTPFLICSPTGRYHSSAGYGMTDCGVDATGDNWLWPL